MNRWKGWDPKPKRRNYPCKKRDNFHSKGPEIEVGVKADQFVDLEARD